MSDPKYRPRDYCLEPDGFGRVAAVAWFPVPEGREAAAHAAAILQHHYALIIRRQVAARGSNAKEYARAAGTGYDRLLKMLRGDIVMRLEDIAMADLLIGQVSELARLEPSGDTVDLAAAPSPAETRAVQRHYRAAIREWRR